MSTTELSDRQRSIVTLAAGMGYHNVSPDHARSIDALAADEIRERYGDLLDELGDNPALTVETQRRIEDAVNPILRESIRRVMNLATPATIAGTD